MAKALQRARPEPGSVLLQHRDEGALLDEGSGPALPRHVQTHSGQADRGVTGTVQVDMLFQAPDPARSAGAGVTFQPGARTAWHTHPLGQTLIVTSGRGRVQRQGCPVEEIEAGDVVWFEPGEKHWHGATADRAMTQIAIQEEQVHVSGPPGVRRSWRCPAAPS